METKFLTFTSQECLDIIKSNEVLSFPTETVYGLGVIYDSKEAFDRLCKLKNRIPDNKNRWLMSFYTSHRFFYNLPGQYFAFIHTLNLCPFSKSGSSYEFRSSVIDLRFMKFVR